MLFSLSASAYTLNYARPAINYSPALKNTSISNLSNIELMLQIRNMSCKECPSEGIQSGCIIFRQKVLELLGEPKPKFSVIPSYISPYTKKMICYKDLGGYAEFGAGYHIVILKNNNIELPLNRTIYPKGVRVYNKKGVLKNET